MATDTLEEVKRLVDQLTPNDQGLLIEYLRNQKPFVQNGNQIDEDDAWQELFHIGDSLSKDESKHRETMTQVLLSSRR